MDNPPMAPGSLVYPVFAAYAAAVASLDRRVRFIDFGAYTKPVDTRELRHILETHRPDEIVWVSSRGLKCPIDRDIIPFKMPPFTTPIFPYIDRWLAERYYIANAPGAKPWQLQVHCLALGAEWFAAYLDDLALRFPAFAHLVVFGLETCDYQDAALEALARFPMPWAAFAGARLLDRFRDCMQVGCCGFTVGADDVDPAQILPAVLAGMHIHGIGASASAAKTIPFTTFTKIETAAKEAEYHEQN
ncbi:MAG: hypothetical protein D6692_00005 [Planctomycetota bacterium]|nr:MAG: hypothetical protein D6692_00005 [Planctomycetota bacterium]